MNNVLVQTVMVVSPPFMGDPGPVAWMGSELWSSWPSPWMLFVRQKGSTWWTLYSLPASYPWPCSSSRVEVVGAFTRVGIGVVTVWGSCRGEGTKRTEATISCKVTARAEVARRQVMDWIPSEGVRLSWLYFCLISQAGQTK